MFDHLGFTLRQVSYDLRAGLLFRPALITIGLGTLAPVLAAAEARLPILGAWSKAVPWLASEDVGAAQMLLTTVAGAMATVLSLTYSVLLMALTLASMQFSPRILFGFLRDEKSQQTLGLFVGTFLYCLLLLRLLRPGPAVFLPQLAMQVALLLALVSLGWLLYFLHHITQSIQANHLVDRIATETEVIIDEVFPQPLGDRSPAASQRPALPTGLDALTATRNGYVQLTDEESLGALARQHGVTLHLHAGPGEFVTAGSPLVSIEPRGKLSPELRAGLTDAFDLGPVRTMQQDVEYGFRQIVDIALKAISPAVNDPSTAVTCIDHLGRLLSRLAARQEPPQELREGDRPIVWLRRTTFRRLVDLTCNQIRQYGRADMAVNLRLLRALHAVAASTRHRPYLDAIERQANLLAEASRGAFLAGDCAELEARHEALRALFSADR